MATRLPRIKARILFQADFEVLSNQFAGLVLARRLKLYEKAGLDVTLRGHVKAGTEPEVVAAMQDAATKALEGTKGKPVVALGTAEQNVVVPAQLTGVPVVGISAILQRSPLALAALPSAKVKNLSQLGASCTVGMLSDSVTLIQALLRGHVEALPTVLELTNATKVQQLLDGKVDAIQIYDATEPLEIEQRAGQKPVILPIGQQLGYGQVIFGHGPTLRKEAEAKAVQTFLKLTYKGWKEAKKNPEEAAKVVVEERKKAGISEGPVIDSLEFQTKSLRNILKYVVPKPLGNIGAIDPKRWEEANLFMVDAGFLERKPKTTATLSTAHWPPLPKRADKAK